MEAEEDETPRHDKVRRVTGELYQRVRLVWVRSSITEVCYLILLKMAR